jgi:hypothetical protein
MRKMLAAALAVASLTASAAGAQAVLGAQPEVRPDTLVRVQGRPPWAACVRWDARTLVCRDASWRGRNWRAWYGRSTCRRGHGWWIDNRGRWRRC